MSGDQRASAPWEPMLLRGRWVVDEWGTGWLQVAEVRPIPIG
jgi:hypothetical protein